MLDFLLVALRGLPEIAVALGDFVHCRLRRPLELVSIFGLVLGFSASRELARLPAVRGLRDLVDDPATREILTLWKRTALHNHDLIVLDSSWNAIEPQLDDIRKSDISAAWIAV